jgi:MFS family permease
VKGIETTLWTGFATSFHEMLAARFLMGVSEACYIPAALALITDYHKGKTRSLATGLHMSDLYAGLALGGLGDYISNYGAGVPVSTFSESLALYTRLYCCMF